VGFQGALRWLAATALGCLALALLTAPPAGAVPTWLSPVNLSAGGQNAEHPKVALDSRGDAVAVWSRFNGTNWIVQAAVRSAGGQWQAPIDLSADGQNTEHPEIAVDSRGEAVAVWERYNGANWILQSAVRPAHGEWQAPVDLADERETAYEPQVAMDPHGDAVAVWRRSNGPNYGANRIVQSALRPAGGEWQAPVNLSAEGENSYEPQVALDHHGDAVAIWGSYNGVAPRTFIIQSALRPAGGSWQAPVNLSEESTSSYEPQVALDARGDAIAVWQRISSSSPWAIQSAVRAAGGEWQAPVDLSEAGPNTYEPQVAVDARGDAVAVWRQSEIIQSTLRPAGGSWQVPGKLSPEGHEPYEPQVAMDPHGDAVAVWERYNGANWVVQGAIRPRRRWHVPGGWDVPVNLSEEGQSARFPQVALDARGDAIAVWQRYNGTDWIIQGAG
jgi:hypothetical protein